DQPLQNGPGTGFLEGSREAKRPRRGDVILTLSKAESGPKRPFSSPPVDPSSGLCCAAIWRDSFAYSAASASIDFGLPADIMKSLMRGTISERKREPLNTP